MSHNRRMFGGRPGGPGGPVSPWEGGVVPGQGRPASAGILGAAPQPLNLLSQLSTPEAQLALASNLLTSLLGQQQQQASMPQPRVPPGPQPLLSMNATAPGRGFFPRPDNMKGGGPMRQQRGHGNRFPDNYNKQRGDNRMRQNAPMNKRGGGSGGQQRNQRKSGGGTPNKSSAVEKKSDSEKTTPAKDENDEKKEESEASKTDAKEEEEDEEAEEGKKRDWKDEKNKKDSSMDVEEEQEDKDDKDGTIKGGKGASGKDASSPAKGAGKDSDASRYANIPKELLVCHICNKNMWDGQSFENHLRGKSHQMMMDQTEKTYKVQVKLMRQELKLAEEKREIEMERVQRLGKKVTIKPREYCTMCDLYFFGNIMGHRKNQLHQNLKNFLHPRCLICSQEFPSRTEWDHHQLTPIHLVKLAESQKNEGKESTEVAMVVEDEPAPADGEEKPTEGAEPATGEGGGSAADGEVGAADAKASGGAAGDAADAKAVGGGGSASAAGAAGTKKPSGRQTVPPYDPKKSYGTHLLKKVLGYTCDVCNRFFFQHKEALAHCQTAPHYKSYAAYLLRTGAAAPPTAPRPGPKAADKAPATAAATSAATTSAATTSAATTAPSTPSADKTATDKSAEDAAAGPDGKRARKEGGDAPLAPQGEGEAKATATDEGDAEPGDEASTQEQGADSTTESDDKGEEQGAGADDSEVAEAGGGEPATNGVAGEETAEAQDEGGEEAADEDETGTATPDKAADDDAMDAEEDAAPATASSPSKADADKKYGGSSSGGGGQANRRGMGRGIGRGRGRGHRRR